MLCHQEERNNDGREQTVVHRQHAQQESLNQKEHNSDVKRKLRRNKHKAQLRTHTRCNLSSWAVLRDQSDMPTADAELPEEFEEAICGSLEPFEFTGGFANPGGGNLLIYISDADCDFAEGSFMHVTIFPKFVT